MAKAKTNGQAARTKAARNGVAQHHAEPDRSDPEAAAAALSRMTGGMVKVTYEPGMYDDRDESERGNMFHARIPEGAAEFPDHCHMFLDRRQPGLKQQLVKELRRVAAIYSQLADKVERPKGTPPLTYAVVSVPDGRIIERGRTRDEADYIAWIWNQDGTAFWRAAVLPDADLRCDQPGRIETELEADKWPKFPIAIFEQGDLKRIEQLPDPRLEWCKRFNEIAHKADNRTVAQPLYHWDEENAIEAEGGAT